LILARKGRWKIDESASASIKKTKTAQMIMPSADSSSLSGLIWNG